jgi:hypothetical protein
MICKYFAETISYTEPVTRGEDWEGKGRENDYGPLQDSNIK